MKIYRILGHEGRVTIPYGLRQAVGFRPEDVVSFEIIGENAILVCREQVVGRDIPKQPVPKAPELLVYLESLSSREQYEVLVHLSVLWAEHQSKPPEREGELCE